jgi:hypothetical protein
MGNEAILADKVTKFSRDYMFPCYKFLKEGWQDYNPTNNKSLSYFVGRKMADTYRSMRIPTIGRECVCVCLTSSRGGLPSDAVPTAR